MKIAVIGAKGLPARQGGIEQYCSELYPRMVAQGHQVDLYARATYIDKPWFSSYDYQGVKVICLPSIPLKGIDALSNCAIAALVATLQNYDVIHFHALGPALFSVIPRLIASSKIVVTCQGLDWQRAKWGQLSSQIIHLGEKTAVKCSDEIVVVSQALQSYFEKTYQLNTNYIPNGPGKYVDSDPNFPFIKSLGLTQGKYLLFLGRLVPEKRPELLVAAYQKLQNPQWKLVLTGGTSDTDDYIDRLKKMAKNNPQILFTGELKGESLAEIVRGSGLFVLPSDLEGLPLVMLEAMREGIPVLASDIEPHQQLIGEDRGMMFQAGNIASCCQALEKAIASPQNLIRMAQKAQTHIYTYYTWEKIMSDNLALYEGKSLNLKPKALSGVVR